MREWDQREAEYRLSSEYRDRQWRLFREKQAIRLDVLASEVDVLQADTIRWTAWYNLQLARLDILRATELLLDYIEKAGIAAPAGHRGGYPQAGAPTRVAPPSGPPRPRQYSRRKGRAVRMLSSFLSETGLIAVARGGAGAAGRCPVRGPDRATGP